MGGTGVYKNEREFVKECITVFSSECGVPEDVVWNALKQGYFGTLDLRSEEIRTLIEETLSPDFLDELQHARLRSEIKSIPRSKQRVRTNWPQALKAKIIGLLSQRTKSDPERPDVLG